MSDKQNEGAQDVILGNEIDAESKAQQIIERLQGQLAPLLETATPEQRRYFEIAKKGIKHALSTISQRFEGEKQRIEYRSFHNTDHTVAVIERSVQLLLKLKQQNGKLGQSVDLSVISTQILEAAFHDIVQNYQLPVESTLFHQRDAVGAKSEVRGKKRVRKPLEGNLTNERLSAQELIAFLTAQESEVSQEQMQQYITDIETTIPGFDGEGVIQPNFTKESSLNAKILALADLGTVGMSKTTENPVQVLAIYDQESDKNFREDNIDIYEAIYLEKRISLVQAKNFSLRILKWTADEANFVQSRKSRYAAEQNYFDDPTDQAAIWAAFLNFSDSDRIQTLSNHVGDHLAGRLIPLENGKLREVLVEMGYDMSGVTIEGEIAEVLSNPDRE